MLGTLQMVGYLLEPLDSVSPFCLVLSRRRHETFFRTKLYGILYLYRGWPKATRIPTTHPTAALGDVLYHDFLAENGDTLENYFSELLRRAIFKNKVQKDRVEPSSAFVRTRSSPERNRDRFLKKSIIFEKYSLKGGDKTETGRDKRDIGRDKRDIGRDTIEDIS